jgi:hypothetical protein
MTRERKFDAEVAANGACSDDGDTKTHDRRGEVSRKNIKKVSARFCRAVILNKRFRWARSVRCWVHLREMITLTRRCSKPGAP